MWSFFLKTKGITYINFIQGGKIEKEKLDMIFEKFFRADTSRTSKTGGTGLGLAIVKHITEVHGAQLDIQSTPDVGTTIQITFNKSA